jgi:hypothetical protein
MSESAPEAPSSRSSGGNVFTQRIGPLPMWAWVAVIGGALIAWRLYSSHKSAAATAQTDTSSVPADQVPQFVNQTYVQTTAPTSQSPGPQGPQGPPGTPGPAPKPSQLTRTWESLGGSTYAEVAQRLLGNTDVANLHPADAKTAKWVENVYEKNRNAKMPKGLRFTYTEGTVTAKGK